jgi:hypothetical protein
LRSLIGPEPFDSDLLNALALRGSYIRKARCHILWKVNGHLSHCLSYAGQQSTTGRMWRVPVSIGNLRFLSDTKAAELEHSGNALPPPTLTTNFTKRRRGEV